MHPIALTDVLLLLLGFIQNIHYNYVYSRMACNSNNQIFERQAP